MHRLFIAATAFAADLGSEITNAQTHAGLAAKAADINGVHMHMHHALNCLVGPGGDGFDAKQMNPCAQSGNGAIPDEMDAAKKAKLTTAGPSSPRASPRSISRRPRRTPPPQAPPSPARNKPSGKAGLCRPSRFSFRPPPNYSTSHFHLDVTQSRSASLCARSALMGEVP